MRDMRDDGGSALLAALLSTIVMLALGLALLAIVDTQANESATERTRDQAFNLSESVLTSEAFVLGRNWPQFPALSPVGTNGTGNAVPASDRLCGNTSIQVGGTLGASAPAGTAAALLAPNLNASYTDPAYANATWQMNACDNTGATTVWSDGLLTDGTTYNWDVNGDGIMWVRAQATVGGRVRAVAGLVKVRRTTALAAKYALTSGGVTDDLGLTVNTLSASVAGQVLTGLIGTARTVASDPGPPAVPAPGSGVTGLRCGALDISNGSTCVAGTLGAMAGNPAVLPAVSSLLTGNTIEQIPTLTAADDQTISQLRSQAVASHTYVPVSAGSPAYASAPPCTLTGTPSPAGTPTKDTVVFIEQVGTSGTNGTAGGPGDQYCVLDVNAGKAYKALIIGSGRVIVRGSNPVTAPSGTATAPAHNMFYGVVYALNLQRLPVSQGGRGLTDAPTNSREVVVIDGGAHVKGAVHADGKSARVTIIPPPLTLDTNALVDSLIPCTVVLGITSCVLRNTIKALGSTLNIVNQLVTEVGAAGVVSGILGQLNPQRAAYGSAITSDVTAVNNLTVYGASGVVPGTFRDLQPRV